MKIPKRNKLVIAALKEQCISYTLLAQYLGVKTSSIHERLNQSKEIDSIPLISAVCELTGFHPEQLIPELNRAGNAAPVHAFTINPEASGNDLVMLTIIKFGINKQELARKCGISYSALRDRLNNPRGIHSIKFILELANFTNNSGLFFFNMLMRTSTLTKVSFASEDTNATLR